MSEQKRIIEIDGIKMEVDLRTATRVDQFKVGSAVSLLITKDNEVFAGVIIDFEEFKAKPTIVVAYIKTDYYGSDVKYAFINKSTTDQYEIILNESCSRVHIDKAEIIRSFNTKIKEKNVEIKDLQTKKDIFIEKFGMYFSDNE